jgi:hypothetical protein
MATDIRSTNAILKIESNKRVKVIYTGEGTFVARARRAVRKIPESCTHILYLQEDMWLTSSVRRVFLEKTICLMDKYSLSTVKLANSTFLSHEFLDSAARYKNRFTKDFEFFGNSSYCMSHHPSIFHKKYLYLSFCIALIMGRTAPHAHEALISAAVRHYSRPSILINLVTILRYSDRPLIEFIHASEQGKFTDAAIAYMKQQVESPLAGRN